MGNYDKPVCPDSLLVREMPLKYWDKLLYEILIGTGDTSEEVITKVGYYMSVLATSYVFIQVLEFVDNYFTQPVDQTYRYIPSARIDHLRTLWKYPPNGHLSGKDPIAIE